MGYIGSTPTAVPLTGADIEDGTIQIADLSATGTPSSSTFLRGDNSWVAAGGVMTPAFMAYANTGTSIPANTDTKVTFDTEVFDTDGCYDNSTNYRFTPTTSGKYFLSAYFDIDTNTDDTHSIMIFKNGSAIARMNKYIGNWSGSGSTNFCINYIAEANGSTDYFEVYARVEYPRAVSSNIYNGFMGYKIIE